MPDVDTRVYFGNKAGVWSTAGLFLSFKKAEQSFWITKRGPEPLNLEAGHWFLIGYLRQRKVCTEDVLIAEYSAATASFCIIFLPFSDHPSPFEPCRWLPPSYRAAGWPTNFRKSPAAQKTPGASLTDVNPANLFWPFKKKKKKWIKLPAKWLSSQAWKRRKVTSIIHKKKQVIGFKGHLVSDFLRSAVLNINSTLKKIMSDLGFKKYTVCQRE